MDDYDWADLIDNEDKVRMLISPSSEYAMAGAWAMGRAMDDAVISAASGTAYSGAAGGTSVALASAQKIVHGSAGLTLTKLLSAKEIIDSSDVDPDEPRYMIVTAKQLQNVLGVEQLTSADYASVKALVQGEIDTFLGFNFIRTERLVTDGSNRLALAFTQNAIGLALGQDINTKISERADKNYATQVFLSMSIGATRVEDEKVVEIACVES
tara:strand:- start:441 stop:1076 length:636 start_codon:yes stop_codon:yes gene_type:complete